MLSHAIDVLSIGGVFIDAIVLTVFAQIDRSIGGAGIIGHPSKLTWLGSIDPSNGAMLDELRALDWVPRSLRRRAREIDGFTQGAEIRVDIDRSRVLVFPAEEAESD